VSKKRGPHGKKMNGVRVQGKEEVDSDSRKLIDKFTNLLYIA
jgi:hypothetical protein